MWLPEKIAPALSPSRRSDLQILAFCLLTGFVPRTVEENKNRYEIMTGLTVLLWIHTDALSVKLTVNLCFSRFVQKLPQAVSELSSRPVGTDEVVSFLLHVQSLGYQDKPDYQLLKRILNCSGSRLDLDPPLRPAPESRTKTKSRSEESRNKKSGRGRGQSRAEAMEVDEEEEPQKLKPKQIDPKYLRGPPIYRTQQSGAEPMEVDLAEDEEEQKRKPKQIPVQYLRGPPLYKPHQTERPSRSARHKSKHFHTDDEEEEEEQSRPKPIAACHLRGPPIRAKDTDTRERVSSPERRRRDAAAQNNNNNKQLSQRDSYLTYKKLIEQYSAPPPPRDQPGALFWWLCAGLCFLVVLFTLTF
ncbi:hypothetical protein WMY93_017911 [Mugilogobius chulae]|uniref:Uncharacterized protein n=1 Tax=Mugilogobius chulae TaxID=88201 RepID=A0AAW0NSC7_9GOBI